MRSFFHNKLLLLIILLILPWLFIYADSRLDVPNRAFNSIFFIIATLIVCITIYVILDIVIGKFPGFLDKGIWRNPFTVLIVGSLLLLFMVFAAVLVNNMLELNAFMNKLVTFVAAYPVAFVFIIMIDAFYRGVYQGNRKKRLFISAMTVVFGLGILILFGMLGFR